MSIAKVVATLIALSIISGTAIAGDDIDRQLQQEGRARDLETAREAARMQRQGEREQYLDGLYRRSLRRCRCYLNR
jgi:hypothetical protein